MGVIYSRITLRHICLKIINLRLMCLKLPIGVNPSAFLMHDIIEEIFHFGIIQETRLIILCGWVLIDKCNRKMVDHPGKAIEVQSMWWWGEGLCT